MRPSKAETFILMADILSKRSTCVRRQVGCVLVNKHFHVIGTGYNGVAAGQTHCIDKPCPGHSASSGTGLDLCEAIHAEQNALLQCKDVQNIFAVFCTTAPCITCTKLLLNTSAEIIIFRDIYTHSRAEALWVESGRKWLHIEELDTSDSYMNWLAGHKY